MINTGSRAAALLRGLVSFVVLSILLVGIPVALIALSGNPVPSSPPELSEITGMLSRRDDGSLFIGIVKIATWAAWAAFAFSCLTEVFAVLRGLQTPSLPALGGTQRLAAYLIASITLAFSATSANAAVATASSTVPANVAPAAAPHAVKHAPDVHASQEIHVVQPGESLWGISQDELGDGDRYMEIFKASTRLDQPRGVPRLTDPRLIHPHERLVIPQVKEAPADRPKPPDDSRHDVGQDQDGSEQAPASDGAKPSPAVPSPSASPQASEQEEAPPLTAQPSPATTHSGSTTSKSSDQLFSQSIGFSALAAAGLVALLAAKRIVQQRRRRPGHRIKMPDTMSEAEWDSRVHQVPATADRLDQALRSLAKNLADAGGALPRIQGVNIAGSSMTVTLAEPVPAALPTSPFVVTSDLTWTLDGPGLLAADQLQDVPAPYPALVTLGSAGSVNVLVDLESSGTLGLVGQQNEVEEVLTALAVELATSRWADHLLVLCVGFAPELPPALSSGRLRHLATLDEALIEIQEHVRDLSEALNEAELSHARHTRVTHTASGPSTPLIVLSALPADAGQHGLLHSLTLGRGGLGAVVRLTDPAAADPTAWIFDATADRTVGIPILDSPIMLQRIVSTSYEDLIDDFSIASDLHSIPDPLWLDVPPEPDDLLAYMAPAEEPKRPALQLLPADVPPPEQPEPVPENEEPPQLIDTSFGYQPGQTAPYLRVLGRVQVEGRDVANLEPGKRGLLVELAAYLKLNPVPSAEEVSKALGGPRGPWSASTRASNMSRLRAWFGRDPEGHSYVPSQGNGRLYTLTGEVGCDWEHFQILARRGLNHIVDGATAAGTNDLRAALELVRGQPFGSAGPDRFHWAEHLKQEMISVIVDITHALALALLEEGSFPEARAVLAKGLDIEPGSELLYRDLFRAEHRAGNRQGLNDSAERLLRSLYDLGLEMEPETAELLDGLLNNKFRRAAGGAVGPV